jgi:HSP20 family protein
VDLHEDGESYVLRADVPGVEPGEVQLEFEGAEMVLTGRRSPDPAVPRDAYLRVERPSGPFVIRLSVPQGVDRAAVEATQRNGVVQVVLPKRRADDGSSRVVVTAT